MPFPLRRHRCISDTSAVTTAATVAAAAAAAIAATATVAATAVAATRTTVGASAAAGTARTTADAALPPPPIAPLGMSVLSESGSIRSHVGGSGTVISSRAGHLQSNCEAVYKPANTTDLVFQLLNHLHSAYDTTARRAGGGRAMTRTRTRRTRRTRTRTRRTRTRTRTTRTRTRTRKLLNTDYRRRATTYVTEEFRRACTEKLSVSCTIHSKKTAIQKLHILRTTGRWFLCPQIL